MTDTLTESLSPTQIDRLEKFASRISKFNSNLAVFDVEGNCLINCPADGFDSDVDQLGEYARASQASGSHEVQRYGRYGEVLGVCLGVDDQVVAVAIVNTGESRYGDNEELRRVCGQYNIDYELISQAVKPQYSDDDYLCEILTSFAEEFRSVSKASQQFEIVSTELTQTYEELMLFYKMSTNMKVTQSDASYLQMACDEITKSVNVEGIAIFSEKKVDGDKTLTLTAGSGVVVIDHNLADILQTQLGEELRHGHPALLDSCLDGPFKYDWPDRVKNIIAVPLQGNDRMIGLMIGTNIVDKADFDSLDVKLFNSVAHQCAVFIENGRLFKDLKELFIGSLKALTNSIDAKDQYTRGHSDRVAFISRWIAERYSADHDLDEEQIHEIYLAGLLHDIGKIGINEAVLRKKGSLSDDDRREITAHPRIGASILGDIKQMRGLIPGVLYHHERMDGCGYPEGLSGDDIPVIGRIIGLADAFDAMTSKRTYREAMSIKRAAGEIRKCLGSQFDEEIGRIFIESDLAKLWRIIQDGYIESWDYSNFSEYGTTAVGTLLHKTNE